MKKNIYRYTFNILIIYTITFLTIGCTNNNCINEDDELANIINFFITEYKVSNAKNFLISEHDLVYYDSKKKDSLNYIYLHIQAYQNDTPFVEINSNRELFRTNIESYTIYYELNKGDLIKISNCLEWQKVKPEMRKKDLMIVDYIELQCLYNLKTKKLEL